MHSQHAQKVGKTAMNFLLVIISFHGNTFLKKIFFIQYFFFQNHLNDNHFRVYFHLTLFIIMMFFIFFNDFLIYNSYIFSYGNHGIIF